MSAHYIKGGADLAQSPHSQSSLTMMNEVMKEEISDPSDAAVREAYVACNTFLSALKPLKIKRSPVQLLTIKAKGGESVLVCSDKEHVDHEITRFRDMYDELDIHVESCPLGYTVRDNIPRPPEKLRLTAVQDDALTNGPDAMSKRAFAVSIISLKRVLPRYIISSRRIRFPRGVCLICCQKIHEGQATQTPCCQHPVCQPCVQALTKAWYPSPPKRKIQLMKCIICKKKMSACEISQIPASDTLAARYMMTFGDTVRHQSTSPEQSSDDESSQANKDDKATQSLNDELAVLQQYIKKKNDSKK